MSVTSPEPPTAGHAGRGSKRIPTWAIVAGVLVTLGGIAFFLYERRKGAATTTAATAATTGSTAAGTNLAGEISTLQTEIADLQGELAGTTSTSAVTGSTSGSSSSTGGMPAHAVITATGTESLNKLAAAHSSTGAAALQFTSQYKPHKSAAEQTYIRRGNPQARLSAGTIWWVPRAAPGVNPGGPDKGVS